MRTERPTEVLLVEDDEDDLELALRALKSANLSYPIHVSRDGLEALDFIFASAPTPIEPSTNRLKSWCWI